MRLYIRNNDDGIEQNTSRGRITSNILDLNMLTLVVPMCSGSYLICVIQIPTFPECVVHNTIQKRNSR